MAAKTKTHRYRVTLDLNDPEERALSDLLDALKPRNNGRTSFQRLALLNYMSSLVRMDLGAIDSLEEAQLAVLAQMVLKGRGVDLRQPATLAPTPTPIAGHQPDVAAAAAGANGIESVPVSDEQGMAQTHTERSGRGPQTEPQQLAVIEDTQPTSSKVEPNGLQPAQRTDADAKQTSPLKQALASIM